MTIYIDSQSKTYGLVKYQCIGIVDFSQIIKLGHTVSSEWTDKYHPMHYFKAAIMIPLSEINAEHKELREMGRYAIFVPTETMNHDWDNSYWVNQNNIQNKKSKLPIAHSEKEIKIWINSLDNELLTPSYFKNANSILYLQSDLPKFQVKCNINQNEFYFLS